MQYFLAHPIFALSLLPAPSQETFSVFFESHPKNMVPYGQFFSRTQSHVMSFILRKWD